MTIPQYFIQKAKEIQQIGGQFYAVGGYVRDYVMGVNPKDIDFVVSNITVQQAQAIFGQFTPIHPKAPVYSVFYDGVQYEVAMPRIEVQTGHNKQEFEFVITTDITKDAERRDFTINAMFMDVVSGQIIDPYNGQTDIQNKVIRHASHKFSESPERIFRAIAFQARFGFDIAPETIMVIKQMVQDGAMNEIPVEQVWKQGYAKIFSGKYFHKAFTTMVECGFAPKEITDMVGCQQSPVYHPEGDAFNHSCFVAEYMAVNFIEGWGVPKDIAVAIAFSHDMGKPETTKIENGKVTAYGHEDSHVPYQFMTKIGFPVSWMEVAKSAIQNHMSRFSACTKKEVGKFARKAGKFVQFNFAVIKADCMGRSTASHISQNIFMAEKMATTFKEADTFTSFISGEEIMAICNIKPSKMVGQIKEFVIEAQIEGQITTKEEAIQFVSNFKI